MGTLFWLINGHEEHIEYAKQENLLPNPDFQFGRLPTYNELKQILTYLPQYTVIENGGDIYLKLEDGFEFHLSVPLANRPRSDAGLIDFYWKYTSEPIMPLLQAIADVCGTMVIFNDTDPDGLVFVYPNTPS